MTCFLPIFPDLRSSFLLPVGLAVTLPARSANEQDIARAGIRVHRHIVCIACSASQWLSLRAFVERKEGKHVVCFSRGQELNTHKIIFSTYVQAAKYCVVERVKFDIYTDLQFLRIVSTTVSEDPFRVQLTV